MRQTCAALSMAQRSGMSPFQQRTRLQRAVPLTIAVFVAASGLCALPRQNKASRRTDFIAGNLMPSLREASRRRLVSRRSTVTKEKQQQKAKTIEDRVENRTSILRELTEARSPKQVLAVLENHGMDPGSGFSFVHASAALHSLAARRDTLTQEVIDSPILPELARATKSMLSRGETHVETLPIMIWALAALRRDMPWLVPQIMPELVKDALLHTEWLHKGHLGRVVWAVATLKAQAQEMQRLLPPALACIETKISEITAHNVANIIWSIATLKHEVPNMQRMLPMLAKRAAEVQDQMSPQNAGNIIWAASELENDAPDLKRLLPAMARIACPDGVGLDKISKGGIGGGWVQ